MVEKKRREVARVKICGITNVSDAYAAVECGANALGFIFYQKSQRYVSPKKAKEMIERLPWAMIKVGVFVNQEVEEVKEITNYCGLNLVQLHGDESPQYCSQFPVSSLIKAVSPRTEKDVLKLKKYHVRAILADARKPGCYGGIGKITNWRLAIKVKEIHPLILSGGLNSENIREAIETVRPQAVDVNSGVEISPGKKDPDKIRKLIEIVRDTERQQEGFSDEDQIDDANIFT